MNTSLESVSCKPWKILSWQRLLPLPPFVNVGANFAVPDLQNVSRINVRETTGPRLTLQEIQQYSRQDNLCLFNIDHNRVYSRSNGFFPMFVDWPMPAAEYRRRRDHVPWPLVNAATLQIETGWPMPNGDTIVATSHPELDPPPEVNKSAEKLREIRRKLRGDEL